MKFGIMFANAGPFGEPELLAHLAQTAEAVGVESIFTVEHVAVPVGYESQYPYSKSGKMPGPESSPIPDPLLPLAFVASITKSLRLGTGILILPQRHPIYVAKEIATLDVLSGGRVLFGIGSGWLQEEFEALGVPFNQRGRRTDEAIEAIRSLWAPEPKAFEGKYYAWNAVHSNPKPVQQPGVPILIGGHSEAAARRAARLGDGFFPARGDDETLLPLLAEMRAECERVGRDPSEIEITTGVGQPTIDKVRHAEELGICRLVINPPGFDRDGLTRGLEDFAEQVIAKL
ncbi:MAG: LLM class F420-dependent oxidoreductase [Myxococcales bacterium]|nr:LLM class F420-dependent oxidoreductase [Myxococcales bacterium]